MGKKVLLTGFDPFGGETVNPSWEAVKRLNGEKVEGVSIVAEQILEKPLPVHGLRMKS